MMLLANVLICAGIVLLFLVGAVIALLAVTVFCARTKRMIPWDDLDEAKRKQHRVQDANIVQRLLKQDWSIFHEKFEADPPQALLRMYNDSDYLLTQDFLLKLGTDKWDKDVYEIANFLSLEDALIAPESAVCAGEKLDLPAHGFYFARSMSGDTFYIKPKESDTVYYYEHDGNRSVMICSSLGLFLMGKRFIRK